MGSLLAAVLARAEGFLVEPATPAAGRLETVPPAASPIQVAVTGLSRGSGATTIAAGLAHALVVPDERSGHLISLTQGAAPPRRLPGVAAWDLPPALTDPREIAEYGATLGRVAAGGGAVAVVWDVRADDATRAARVLEECDALVCVAEGAAEPALSRVVCDMIGERLGRIVLVANRVRDDERWTGRCTVAIPESRLAAL